MSPFKKLFSNVKSTVKVRPLRRTLKAVSESAGVAKIPYGELKVSIDADYLEQLFDQQGGKCYWLGIPLDPSRIFIKKHPLAMSVDRLDNKKGYVPGNVVIACRMINLGKLDYPSDEFSRVISEVKDFFLEEKRNIGVQRQRFLFSM